MPVTAINIRTAAGFINAGVQINQQVNLILHLLMELQVYFPMKGTVVKSFAGKGFLLGQPLIDPDNSDIGLPEKVGNLPAETQLLFVNADHKTGSDILI